MKDNPRQTVALKAFRATLERTESRLQWVIARIPFDVAKAWGKRGQIRVKGEINGFRFATSLFPTGEGTHVLLVNKKMLAGAGAALGDVVGFRLEPDTAKRVVAMPPELERALGEDRKLRRWFEQLSPSARTSACRFVEDVKSAEARERRAGQMAEQLLATMEAETELPPVLRLAFARDPVAYKGWRKMGPAKRRGHLFGVFYYRTPEAQGRRIEKLLQDARGSADSRSGS